MRDDCTAPRTLVSSCRSKVLKPYPFPRDVHAAVDASAWGEWDVDATEAPVVVLFFVEG